MFLSGCYKNWKEEDKVEFLNDCILMHGSEQVCLCVLNCLESEYDNYMEVLNKIPKSELNKRIKKCLKKCKN